MNDNEEAEKESRLLARMADLRKLLEAEKQVEQTELESNLVLADLVLDEDYLLRLRGSASIEETQRIVDEHLKTEFESDLVLDEDYLRRIRESDSDEDLRQIVEEHLATLD